MTLPLQIQRPTKPSTPTLPSAMASQLSLPLSQMILFMLAVLVSAEAFYPSSGLKVDGRAHVASIADFGGVGDGKTLNTDAFRTAIANLTCYASDGGSALVVPAGQWLTGPFNLSSHFTLYLEKDAVLLASQDKADYPIIAPLPSYGTGNNSYGNRFHNFIMGTNLTDVTITGQNGTIDGQGKPWWDKFRAKVLNTTRGFLIEFLYSDQITISNVTLLNSPNWFVHPAYSTNVVVTGVTILAPVDSPNTDGIDPDSCSNVRIEDCFIVSGDDCIAIKSGVDQYGIAFNMPSEHIIIRRLSCISPSSAVIALGSEMSGGIRDVRAEDITAINSESGVRIKTAIGRGAYVKDIFVRGMKLHTMKWVFWMTGNYGHPGEGWDPKAIPVVEGISYSNIVAENVTMVAKLEGIHVAPFTGICISNMTAVQSVTSKKLQWNCTDIEGITGNVVPTPCAALPDKQAVCPFPTDKLSIDHA